MRTAQQTMEEVLHLTAKHFQIPRVELSPDDDLFKKLGIDSLQTLDLLTRLESHFGVELPDYELQGATDFGALAQRIQTRLMTSSGDAVKELAAPYLKSNDVSGHEKVKGEREKHRWEQF